MSIRVFHCSHDLPVAKSHEAFASEHILQTTPSSIEKLKMLPNSTHLGTFDSTVSVSINSFNHDSLNVTADFSDEALQQLLCLLLISV